MPAQGVIILGDSYHSNDDFIPHCDDPKVNSRNTVFMLQSKAPCGLVG